ncbi:MAG: BMP family ABC transporter substrate-binding protein [Lachnospiraceae bacterium]|nr:BMP family ABC transporter substrate-binding protein [Lachnospiraceae bacterium]
MDNFYEEALKLGQRYYRQQIASGRDPYLPVLNELLPEQMIAGAADIGLVHVPADRIVGTLTAGRSKSFAGNFMPIAKQGTEFSTKWKNLAVSHEEEGIREAVLLYEYMNHYYVQEGNKRVSVQKYFGVVSILATVRRIMPERSDDPKVLAYYEYLEFSKATGMQFLIFSKPGGYEELCRLLGKSRGEVWTEEEISWLRVLYYRFLKVFLSVGGDKNRIEPADALLACLSVRGYSYFSELSDGEMKKELRKVWEEIALQKEESRLEMKLDPEDQGKSMISMILPTKKLKAAFLYTKEAKDSAWVAGHEMARIQVQEKFGERVETAVYICTVEQSVEMQIDRAIKEGANVIFATSAEMLSACLKAAVDAPEVEFMNCSLNKPHRYVRAYYPRMYEGKFVTGAIAGALSKSERIGFICKYPVYGSVAGINAFARGVKMTNPDAKIILKWSALENSGNVLRELEAEGVSLISMLDYQGKDMGIRQMHGLELLEEGELIPLVLPVWNWSVYYEWILQSMLDRTYKQDKERTRRSLQYYWGLSSGAVRLIFAERLPKEVRYLGELLVKAISDGICKPFFEPSQTEDGRQDWEDLDRTIDIGHILEMEDLEDNVIGRIPVYEELTEQAKGLVDIIGLPAAREAADTAGQRNRMPEDASAGKELS